jgi:hypothetical protein
VDDERAGANAGADEERHLRPVVKEWAPRAALGAQRLTVRRQERSIGDADAREIEHGAEVQGESGAARVVAAGCVRDHDLGWLRERANRLLQRRALAQRQ